MKKNKFLAMSMAAVMAAGMLAGCGSGSDGGNSGSSAAAGGADSTGYTYAGEAPITKEDGATLKILAQTSNYTNVDICQCGDRGDRYRQRRDYC